MKKHVNKTLITCEQDEQFQSSNTCWIWEKLTDDDDDDDDDDEDDDEKVIDYWHVTKRFRGAAHWSWNINLRLTKKVPVIFQNFWGYESHLIFCELKYFDVKIDVIPNRLEKYM